MSKVIKNLKGEIECQAFKMALHLSDQILQQHARNIKNVVKFFSGHSSGNFKVSQLMEIIQRRTTLYLLSYLKLSDGAELI